MPEYEGFRIVYEVLAMPKDKWAIMIEIIRRHGGEVLMARHNPFPRQPFDTKLEALEHVNRYVSETVARLEGEAENDRRRRA
ncbi:MULTISPECIES: hypothetical protein [unclassified Cupriavidus]|uniref:hypothetical protein n=1 Tax=unclassified Cupriavidus TaxID=2640874 RepID=UPI0010FA383B|nr:MULTISPECIES: hypothetical protein [unclassified Cupriavidus]MWL86606.1 hypothetical protein [Cupriavidus sp. SW-Y-13]